MSSALPRRPGALSAEDARVWPKRNPALKQSVGIRSCVEWGNADTGLGWEHRVSSAQHRTRVFPEQQQKSRSVMNTHSIRNMVATRFPAWTHPALRSLEMMALAATGGVLRHLPREQAPRRPPQRIAETIQDYAAEHPGKASYKELYPEHTVARPPPRIGSPSANRDGSQSVRLHPAFASELSRTLPSAGVGIIPGGRVLTSMGAVMTPDNYLINDVSHTGAGANPYAHPLFSRLRLPDVHPIDARVAVLTMYPGNLPGRPYYGHWLWDILPRLHLLETSGIGWDYLVVPQLTRYQRESLKLLGIKPDTLIADQGLHLQARELIVPSLAGFPIGNYAAWACQWLRDRFLPMAPPETSSQPRRLYISRAKAATRRILNEDELVSALAPLGFERVFLEEYSFLDGVRLLRDAEAVVSAHGSNITNIVFCKKGTPVIEIFSPKWVAACHYSTACQVELDYGYVVGRGKVSDHGTRLSENILVNCSEVVDLLDRMMGKRAPNDAAQQSESL